MQRASSEILTTLNGRCVAITGVCATVSRDDLKAALTLAGAHITGSVNRYTTLLIAGEHGVGSKFTKAQEMGIHIMPASEMADILIGAGFLNKEATFPTHDGSPVVSTEKAISNVVAMVMLEMGIKTLLVDNLVRAKVLSGSFNVRVDHDSVNNAMRFTLLDKDGNDAA